MLLPPSPSYRHARSIDSPRNKINSTTFHYINRKFTCTPSWAYSQNCFSSQKSSITQYCVIGWWTSIYCTYIPYAPWVGQTVIAVQTYFHRKVFLRESRVQYIFSQGINPLLIWTTNILLCKNCLLALCLLSSWELNVKWQLQWLMSILLSNILKKLTFCGLCVESLCITILLLSFQFVSVCSVRVSLLIGQCC